MIALLSCLLASLALTSRDPAVDLQTWNTTETPPVAQSKPSIAHFRHRPSQLFALDTLCLVWAVVEGILRTLCTPCLYDYFTTLGLFDIIGKWVAMQTIVRPSRTNVLRCRVSLHLRIHDWQRNKTQVCSTTTLFYLSNRYALSVDVGQIPFVTCIYSAVLHLIVVWWFWISFVKSVWCVTYVHWSSSSYLWPYRRERSSVLLC